MQDKIKKQETLEEAAEKWLNKDGFNVYNHYDTRPSFIAGSKWQQEQMYSKEDMEEMYSYGYDNFLPLEEAFKKFKKNKI